MHPSARAQMALCIKMYMRTDQSYRVLDLGSRISRGQRQTHRDLLRGYDCEITGVDIRAGRNVDVVMAKPYRIPVKSNSIDVVLSGQVFEHIPFPWVTILEIARVLRPGGHAFITAPSRGHVHDLQDCWRYYPDSFRALAAFSRLRLKEAHTDFPPVRGRARRRWDYKGIDDVDHYWGDSVGVFRKPADYPEWKIAVPREMLIRWANRVGDLDQVPKPRVRPRRLRLDGVRPAQAQGTPDAGPAHERHPDRA
jgi:SAM-dependent methyltransferase